MGRDIKDKKSKIIGSGAVQNSAETPDFSFICGMLFGFVVGNATMFLIVRYLA